MPIRYLHLLILPLAISLAACSDSDSDNDNGWQPNPEAPAQSDYEPQAVQVSLLKVVDAAGQPLGGVSIAVQPAPADADNLTDPPAISESATNITDGDGELNVDPLAPGLYFVQLAEEGTPAATLLTVQSDNGQPTATIALPILLEQDGAFKAISADTFVGSVNGVIYDGQGPVEGAQVALSAGKFSNGAIASTVTNADGEYFLVLNVGGEIVPALNQVILRVVADGHQTQVVSDLDITNWGAVTGFNSKLAAGEASGEVVYSENFDSVATGALCGSWTGEFLDSVEESNLWHSHSPGLAIINGALAGDLVSLAPDDDSQGYVPDPKSGNSCWYGVAEAAGIEQGNFLLVALDNGDGTRGGETFDGGMSESANAGAIVSPVIDLRDEAAPLALSFDTWWEIEAVNPNEDGFDLMSVEARVEGDTQWQVVARLNPLSDPDTLSNDLPYSNRGYNKAPAWLAQEPISLDKFAGERLQLRFVFQTEDELYNGFRGWQVDNVRIVRENGTFPLWGEEKFDAEIGAAPLLLKARAGAIQR